MLDLYNCYAYYSIFIGKLHDIIYLMCALYNAIWIKSIFERLRKEIYMVLFIYGSRAAAVETYDMVIRNDFFDHRYDFVFFIDDFVEESDYYGTKRIHYESCKDYLENEDAEFIVAVGEPSVRKLLFDRIKISGYRIATLIDKTAIVSHSSTIKEGCIISSGAIVSTNAVINENCLVMFQAIVGHHANVGAGCVICPQATVGGFSNVGDETFLGLGSHMIQNANIGSRAVVGLGAMVFKNVEDDTVVIGNPARVTKGNNDNKVFRQSVHE